MLLCRNREKCKKFFLAKSRVLIFQIKLRTQNFCNYSFLSLYLNNFASQKLHYDKVGPQTMLE